MGAFCAGSYEVTPPGRLRATTSSAGPTDRPKDSSTRQAYGESDPAEDVSHILTGLRVEVAVGEALVGRRPIERVFWPGHNSHARRWGTATTATANCGLRRCTETDLSIVRPTFFGDVADPYVRLGLAIFCCQGNADQRRSR